MKTYNSRRARLPPSRRVAPIASAIGVPKAQEACFEQTYRARGAQQTLLSLRDTESGAFGATPRVHAGKVKGRLKGKGEWVSGLVPRTLASSGAASAAADRSPWREPWEAVLLGPLPPERPPPSFAPCGAWFAVGGRVFPWLAPWATVLRSSGAASARRFAFVFCVQSFSRLRNKTGLQTWE